jgi:hypothetical protein
MNGWTDSSSWCWPWPTTTRARQRWTIPTLISGVWRRPSSVSAENCTQAEANTINSFRRGAATRSCAPCRRRCSAPGTVLRGALDLLRAQSLTHKRCNRGTGTCSLGLPYPGLSPRLADRGLRQRPETATRTSGFVKQSCPQAALTAAASQAGPADRASLPLHSRPVTDPPRCHRSTTESGPGRSNMSEVVSRRHVVCELLGGRARARRSRSAMRIDQ